MTTGIRRMDVEAAAGDLKNRTLAGLAGEFARLVYLASTRNYNTGEYYHQGLAFQFTEEVAGAALAACHQESFRRLVFSPVEDLVKELETYVSSTGARASQVLDAWKTLEPYRVTIPLGCDSLSAEFFFSNVRITLAILEAHQETDADSRQCA